MPKQLILPLILLIGLNCFSRIVYVKAPALGAPNGTSWFNSYTSLTTALNNSIAGDTIKVAMGTYKPGIADTAMFRMRNNVIVLGGYSTDTTIITRNWSLYPTILSGEILNSGYPYDNIKTLIYGFNINSSSIWDGFIAEASNGSSIMLSGNSQPVFRNIVFRNCTSQTLGIALTAQSSSPQFINCVFYNNVGYYCKGVVYSSNNSSPVFMNCLFARNQNSDTASAFYITNSSASITNSTFFGNITFSTTVGEGVIKCTNSSVNITNSIFFHNLSDFDNNNNIFVQDSSELSLYSSSANVSNTIIQNFVNGTFLFLAQNPRFKDTADIDGPDNRFFTSDDGLQLVNPCSPAMNTGNNSAATGYTTDILGNPRIFNNQVIDLGPYETQAAPITPLRTVYVKKSATGANDGSSWTNAFTDLQKALLYCADTIKVAADTYYPSAEQNPNKAFNLENKTILLGGYPSTGNPSNAERNPNIYVTSLSGNLSASIKSLTVIRSKHTDSTCIMDGFEIRQGGVTNYFGIYNSAAVYLTNSSSLIFKNVRITKNQNSPFLLISKSTPNFFDCVIDSNFFGAEIWYSTPTFKRCSFTGNTNGVINNIASQTVIDSCSISRNPSSIIVNNSNSNGVISNCRFINNGTLDTGPDVYNISSSPLVYKCYFSDSSNAQYGGAVRNENLSRPVFRLCEFRNFKVIYTGGVVHNANSSPIFISCVFAGNASSGGGGVVHNINYSTPQFINCAAAYNTAGNGSFMFNDRSFPEIINCTITRHSRVNGGAGASVIANRDSSRLVVKNTILWGNVFNVYNNTIPDIFHENGAPNIPSSTAIFNSVTQYYGVNGVDGNFVGVNPRMFEYNDPDGLDNIYFTADDGMKLTACSPVLNAGNNADVTETNDILLNTRIIGSAVDIGAYEYQASGGGISNVCYVNASATGNNSGTSWANAYTSLWSAINNICADTIKVAAGIYKPAVFNRDSSFLMMHGKVYLGGYPNTGNPTNAERDPNLYPAILSGNIGNLLDSTDNTRHVVYLSTVDGSLTLDGFTIMDGRAEYYNTPQPLYSLFAGGGLISISSRTTILNCVLKNNYASEGGGLAIYAPPTLKISKTLVDQNKSSGRGAGLYLGLAATDKGVIENSVITNNISQSIGGGIFVAGSSSGVDLNNLVLLANRAGGGDGGGIYAQLPGAVRITNCDFLNNSCVAVGRGAGIASTQGYPPITNCLFFGNNLGSSNTEQYLGVDIYDTECPNYNCYRTNVNYTRTQTYTSAGSVGITVLAGDFLNGADPDGADNIWMTADDGLIPLPCSPLNNRGNNAAVAQIPTDMIGNPRIIRSVVDLGAYEAQSASITISASDTLICTGTQITFTANPVYGGTSPTYQWQVNGVNVGTNSNTFSSSSLNNNDQVKVIMTSSETCLTSTPVSSNIITVHTTTSIAPSVSISSSQNIICAGDNVSFIATALNGGASPTYQWQVNGINAGSNSNTFSSSVLTNASQVKVIMTSSYTCASAANVTSNIISITVNPIITPAVNITASATSICAGTTITFTAVPTNGGSAPVYQWKKNGINVGSNNTVYGSNSFSNGDVISVTVTSNASCIATPTANSNTITITVNTVVNPSIAINGNTIVTTGSGTLITSTSSNTGSGPAYQWQDSTASHSWQNITGATAATINYTPFATGDKLRCVLNSDAICASPAGVVSNTLMFTVNAVTGINPVPASAYGIVYFPNPTTNVLIIDSLKLADRWQTVSIASVDGKQEIISKRINNQTRATINVFNLPAGQYVAMLVSKNKRLYLKFIKL
jgi:hypothetical protein